MKTVCRRPWLVADLGRPHRVLSWSLNAPGFATASRIVWREVRDADLPPGLDARLWLEGELRAARHDGAVALVTSRNVGLHHAATAQVEGERAACLATAGLRNAERVGRRLGPAPRFGTINLLVQVDRPLSQGAMVETLSIAAQARTLAVLEAGVAIGPDRVLATGTGTDCIAVASPLEGGEAEGGEACFAGLHTALGEAVGAAVLDATGRALAEWQAETVSPPPP